jgi:hypothetical protein
MADHLTRLQGVLLRSVTRKPRTLRELASDIPGEEWTVADISRTLLELRAGGYVRFTEGAWHGGAEHGKVGHAPIVCKGVGEWDAAAGPMPGDWTQPSGDSPRWACGWGF